MIRHKRSVQKAALVAATCINIAALPASAQTPAQNPTAAQLIARADSIEKTDAAATLRLSQQAINELRGSRDTLLLHAMLLRCWAAGETGADSLMSYAETAVLEAERQKAASNALARTRLCRGYAHEQEGRPTQAMLEYDYAVTASEAARDDRTRANALVHRGELRYYRGEFNTALADLSSAYQISTQLQDTDGQNAALNGIANVYADPRVAEFDKALEYYRQLLKGNEAGGRKKAMASDYFNIASTLERQGKLSEAVVQYQRGLALDEELQDPDEVATDRRAIGVLLYKLGRPGESLRTLDLALAHFRATENEEMVAQVSLSRGVALRMLGRGAEALANLNVAQARFSGDGNQRWLEKTEEERALALASLGRWREAYDARSSQLKLQKSLADQGREEQTSRLRVQFYSEKKEQENRALTRENALRGEALAASGRVRRLQVAVLALSVLIIAVLAAFAARQIANARRMRITALTDDLTGLPNRRHLMLRAEEEFRQARQNGTRFGVMVLDIDHFKRVNDMYGHPVGDVVLKRVAVSLQSALRAGDHVGRTGGEEFVIVLPRAGKDAVDEIANRVRTSIGETDFSDLHAELHVTVSIGAAVSEPNDASFAKIIKRADDSLYVAKEGGRNRVELSQEIAAGR